MNLLWAYAGTAAAVVICALAFWRGGPAERYGAAIILTGWFITPLVDAHGGADGLSTGLGVFAVDVITLITLTWLSLWSRKVWTLFAAAFQLDAVASHIAAFLSHISLFSYVTGLGIWGGYGLILALGVGVWGCERERRRQD
jgi:hypothetical protein